MASPTAVSDHPHDPQLLKGVLSLLLLELLGLLAERCWPPGPRWPSARRARHTGPMRTPRDSAADHRVLPGDRRHRRDDLVREPSAVVGALGGRRDANDDLVAVDLLEQHARL